MQGSDGHRRVYCERVLVKLEIDLTEQQWFDVLHAVAFYRPDRLEAHELFVRRYYAFQEFQRQVRIGQSERIDRIR